MPTQVLVLWSINTTQNPTKAPYGSTITLVPSLGHEPATVPSIPTSYTYTQAQGGVAGGGSQCNAEPRIQHDRAFGSGDLDLAGQRPAGP